MPNEPLQAESAPDSSPAPTDRAADAAMLLAAVERMEAVVRGERAAFDRLRTDLDDMANTVALAKAALATFAIKPDGATDRKSDDVITLLKVIEDRVKAMIEFVAGAHGAPAEPAALEPVAELTASMEPEPVPPTEAIASAQPEPVVSAEPGPADVAPEPQSEPPPAPRSIMPEVDLMTSFAQVAAMPVLPSEIGTAVIFTAKAPEPAATEPAASEPQPVPHEPEPVAAAPEPQPEAVVAPPPAAPAFAETPIVEPPAVELADHEDPAEFLYEPDPDPAADLLEPIEFVPRSTATTSAPVPQPVAMPEPAAPHDPLAPLKTMTDNEKIALFS